MLNYKYIIRVKLTDFQEIEQTEHGVSVNNNIYKSSSTSGPLGEKPNSTAGVK